MKVKLTLKRGAFYFLNEINLLNGQTQEVDLGSLTATEKKGLRTHINAGLIEASKDVTALLSEGLPAEKEPVKEDKPKKKVEAPSAESKEDTKETEETEAEEDRTKWDKNRYKRELNTRRIAYQNSMTIDQLAVILEQDDEKKTKK